MIYAAISNFIAQLWKKKIPSERWQHPDQCDLCGRIPPKGQSWAQEHIFPPDATFVWCDDCLIGRHEECELQIKETYNKYLQSNEEI